MHTAHVFFKLIFLPSVFFRDLFLPFESGPRNQCFIQVAPHEPRPFFVPQMSQEQQQQQQQQPDMEDVHVQGPSTAEAVREALQESKDWFIDNVKKRKRVGCERDPNWTRPNKVSKKNARKHKKTASDLNQDLIKKGEAVVKAYDDHELALLETQRANWKYKALESLSVQHEAQHNAAARRRQAQADLRHQERVAQLMQHQAPVVVQDSDTEADLR